MSIEIEVKNSYAQIKNLSDLTIIDAISNELSYNAGYLTWAQKNSGWDGTYRLLTRKQHFPSGCVPRVTKILNSLNVDYKVIDERQYENPSGGLVWGGPQLYDYQNKAVETCIDKKAGMVKIATGGGKSNIIAKVVEQYNLPTVIYVVSADLLQQLSETLAQCINQPIGIIGSGKCAINKINVCSVWSAAKAYDKKEESVSDEIDEDKWTPDQEQKARIREMIEGAKVCILDEAQYAGANSIRLILANSVSASHRFGFSASPWRGAGGPVGGKNGSDDILLEAAFGEQIIDINASYLIDRGYLVPPRIYFRDIPKYDLNIPKNWLAVKKTYMVNNKERNKIILGNILKLLEMNRKILVLFNDISHGKVIESMLPSDVKYEIATGKTDLDKRLQIKNDFKDGKYDLLLGSKIFSYGFDVPRIDALVMAYGGRSSAMALQKIGRAIRSYKEGEKKDAIIVEFFDQCHYVRDHAYLRYQIYKTEPRFEIYPGKEFDKFLKRKGHF